MLPTSSSGSVVPTQACESSDIATPASTRSIPKRHVLWTNSTRPYGRAVLLVEAPSDTGLAHPGGDGVQIVVGEAELGPHRGGLRQVEHLAGGGPTAGER